jgi:UDP-N-acetylglucosamine transferase subunit ALG13
MAKPLILVTMGTNQYPFTRLYEYLITDPLYTDPRCDWFIQSGECEIKQVPEQGVVEPLVSRAVMEDLVRRSALVISHCGAGTLHTMLSYGKRVIFVPRVARYGEFSDDHQLQIAAHINNSRMQVVYPEAVFPDLDYEQIANENVPTSVVDITNHELACVVNQKLLG